ncbi:AC2 protein [Ramie yellow mosaic virus]|uniref:Transcriptional activator protein n=1 Tax=Ramie mosaic Yunnan virus TaxID=1874886 RepID=A0A1B1QKX2_9GEMI|nr:AC2 protein [Ramie mosaic Yunnan virus]ANT82192.1 AC2 protein [Ramie yellow mosaic virus]ANT82186.1 AC2 protein [Ramie mosaic Yunnan virus]ANT82198.1 AC2 protein [Ramie yellow mosaic virus]AVU88417.1 transactivator protein [Ramie yellow mosaic virus]AVU88423.1 transactivator protein [Ramie yellow mosaic virus]
MQNSSPLPSHCTQVPIKVQHRIAKKKSIRRRRVDLPCGCTYYISINCASHGFTHRGVHHCNSSREWRVYLAGAESPVFQDHETRRETVPEQLRHHHSPSPVQLQPEESIGDTPMFSDLPNLDSFTTSDWAFLKSI